jgi:hypothetical protein
MDAIPARQPLLGTLAPRTIAFGTGPWPSTPAPKQGKVGGPCLTGDPRCHQCIVRAQL